MEQIIRIKLDEEERLKISRALERAYHLADDVLARLAPYLTVLEIKDCAYAANIFAITRRHASSTTIGLLVDEVGFGDKELSAAGSVIREVINYYHARNVDPAAYAPDSTWITTVREDAMRALEREVQPAWEALGQAMDLLVQ